jgi:hypothetical protein
MCFERVGAKLIPEKVSYKNHKEVLWFSWTQSLPRQEWLFVNLFCFPTSPALPLGQEVGDT